MMPLVAQADTHLRGASFMIEDRTALRHDPKRMSPLLGTRAAGRNLAAANLRPLDSVEDLRTTRCSGVEDPQQPAVEHERPAPRPIPRVLCIDDDPEYIQALKIRLESRGISVLRATTGLDGYCCALGESADAILLDYQLPNGCGDYILEQLKSNP